MIATFKEAWASLQDLNYGKEIVDKTFGDVLWYWTKFLILTVAISAAFAVAALTYYAPQLPGILQKNLPDLEFGIKN
jgi:hypothetical protein